MRIRERLEPVTIRRVLWGTVSTLAGLLAWIGGALGAHVWDRVERVDLLEARVTALEDELHEIEDERDEWRTYARRARTELDGERSEIKAMIVALRERFQKVSNEGD